MVDGDVVLGGEADGLRSPGRSPTRSLPDSVQAVSRPKLSAMAQRPLSILFIVTSPPCGVVQPPRGGCNGNAAVRLDRAQSNNYQFGIRHR